MPTYDYECPEGHRFDVSQKMSDEAGADCPECGAPAERKISGGAGFLFKGEGFYITDYRSDDYKKKASAEAAASTPKPSADSESSGGSSPEKSSGDSSSSSSSASSSSSSSSSSSDS